MLAIENLNKVFRTPGNPDVRAVDGIAINAPSGSIVTFLGPSGCGKTTTLRCIAGLERPDSGRIEIAGKVVFDFQRGIFVPPSDRGIGMVFQSYAIWPHMSVFENVAFPLRVSRTRRYSESEIERRVSQSLEMVRLEGMESRPATKLSGGQQQRLAFARGLVHEPRILLLDEPLSNLDAKLRERMRFELKSLQRSLGITTVYVTHDQAEALALSDEVVVFDQGRIVQRGKPQDVYGRPTSRFVADFIGSANFLAGSVVGAPDADGLSGVTTEHGLFRCNFAAPVKAGQNVVISMRPEDINFLSMPSAKSSNVMVGKIAGRVFLGDVIDYVVDIGDAEIRVRARPEHDFRVRQQVSIGILPQKCVGLTA